MASFEVEFDVRCEKCGASLDATATHPSRRNRTFEMNVEPCDKCVEAARAEAYQSGKEDAENKMPG